VTRYIDYVTNSYESKQFIFCGKDSYGFDSLIDPKFFYVLALILIATYACLWVLGQFEWFKKYRDAGLTFAFEAVLAMVALVTGFMGLWFNGYEKGYRDASS